MWLVADVHDSLPELHVFVPRRLVYVFVERSALLTPLVSQPTTPQTYTCTDCNANTTCSAHGSCDPSTAACSCSGTFAGAHCETCVEGWWGVECAGLCPGFINTPHHTLRPYLQDYHQQLLALLLSNTTAAVNTTNNTVTTPPMPVYAYSTSAVTVCGGLGVCDGGVNGAGACWCLPPFRGVACSGM